MKEGFTMKKRLPGLRIAMRIGRRKARKEGKFTDVEAITEALSDRDIQMEVLARLDSKYGAEISAKEIGDGLFLDWLIDNFDVILEIIMKIIGLFG